VDSGGEGTKGEKLFAMTEPEPSTFYGYGLRESLLGKENSDSETGRWEDNRAGEGGHIPGVERTSVRQKSRVVSTKESCTRGKKGGEASVERAQIWEETKKVQFVFK